MKSAFSFLALILAISMSNVVGAGVLLVLLDAAQPENALSHVLFGAIAIACAIVFLDGVVHLGAKYGKRH